MNNKNLINVATKSEFRGFHFLPLFFFFNRFMYLLLLRSFYSSLSAPPYAFPYPPAAPLPFSSPPAAPLFAPSMSCSPTLSVVCCNRSDIKFRHTFSQSSMCFSMFLCVNSSSTSCLFFLTLLITGNRNSTEKNIEQEAAIKRQRNTDMLDDLLLSDWSIMAQVELFKASKTLFRLFYITKQVVACVSVIWQRGKVEIRQALTTISITASQIENSQKLGIFGY